AGRVGAVLAAALRSEGHAITGAYAVSDASVARAEQLLPGVPLLEVADIIERSEMLLLAVPDDQLGPLVAGIAATGLSPGGQLVVHTSGRYGTGGRAPASSSAAACCCGPCRTISWVAGAPASPPPDCPRADGWWSTPPDATAPTCWPRWPRAAVQRSRSIPPWPSPGPGMTWPAW